MSSIHGFAVTLIAAGILVFVFFVIFYTYRCWILRMGCWSVRKGQRRSHPVLHLNNQLNSQTRQDDPEHTGRQRYHHENFQRNDQKRSRPMLYSDYLLNLQTRQDDPEHTGRQRNHHENIQRNDPRPFHSVAYSDTMQGEGSFSVDNAVTEYQQNSQTRQNDSEHASRQIQNHENYTRDNIFTPKGLPSYDDVMSGKFNGNIHPPPLYAEVVENNLGAVGKKF